MEILIQLKNGKVLSINFGRRTKWFQCIYLFHITLMEYDNKGEVIWAKMLFHVFEEK